MALFLRNENGKLVYTYTEDPEELNNSNLENDTDKQDSM